MALAFTKILVAVGLIAAAGGSASHAQGPAPSDPLASVVPTPPALAPAPAPRNPEELVDASISVDCRVPGSRLSRLAPLPAMKAAMAEGQPVRVLALGSAGSVPGFGGATGAYASRIEAELERRLAGSDIVMEQRGLPGEITAEAFDRITGIVTEVEPSLVIWQAGINDALAKADLDEFAAALDRVLGWFAAHEVDVLLVEPPHAAAMAGDEHYDSLVAAVRDGARRFGAPLVLRNGAMRYLGAPKGRNSRPPSAFRLGEMGARCIAEHIGWTVERSLEQTKPLDRGAERRIEGAREKLADPAAAQPSPTSPPAPAEPPR